MKTCGVAIVGGGVVGVACARALQLSGYHVTLIDANEVGRGCSYGNAGLIAVDHILPLSRPEILFGALKMLTDPLGPLHLRWASLPSLLSWFARFAVSAKPTAVSRGTEVLATLLRAAVPAWRRLADEAGEPEILRSQGYVTVFESAQAAAAGLRENRHLQEHGVAFSPLSPSEVHEFVPDLAVRVSAGRYHPEAIYTSEPYQLVRKLLNRFSRDGGSVLEGRKVKGFEIVDGAVVGLKLDGEVLKADRIVLAAGVSSRELAEQLGISAPLTSERGYHVMITPDSVQLSIPVLFADRGFVATPMDTGIRLAGTVEFGAREPNWKRADILRHHAEQLFGRGSLPEVSRWFGDRPTLPDYLPMIGVAPNHPNVTLAFGHQHLGLSLAAVTAELVTDLVSGSEPRFDIASLAASRFS